MSSIFTGIKNLARRLSPLAPAASATSPSLSQSPLMATRSSRMQSQSQFVEVLDDLLHQRRDRDDQGSESSNEVDSSSSERLD
ncbi:unnamed protein product [Cochlearia groenlandica]